MLPKVVSKITKYSFLAAATTAIGVGALSAGSARAFTINFDEALAGTAGDGTIITDQYLKDYGVTFGVDNNRSTDYGLVLYDTECISRRKNNKDSISLDGFTNICTGQDEDLATGTGRYGNYDYDTPLQGNVLIIQENSDYSDPDDDLKGGEVFLNFNTEADGDNIFFEEGVTFDKFGFVDLDEAIIRNKKLSFTFEYVDPTRNPFIIDDSNYVDYIEETLLSVDWDDNALEGDNSLREYSFKNDDGTFDGVKNVTVEYNRVSGAIAYFEYLDSQPVEEVPVDIPEPGLTMALAAVALGGVKLRRKAA
ncbi:MAG: PEP-CTERM sorting domain-containing protein [Cyanobacteria bacterium P01_E01_bin.42]